MPLSMENPDFRSIILKSFMIQETSLVPKARTLTGEKTKMFSIIRIPLIQRQVLIKILAESQGFFL